MSASRTHKYDDFAGDLLVWLSANPDSTYQQIQRRINQYAATLTHPPKKIPDARSVIYYLRGELGPETVTCKRSGRTATYRVAGNRGEAMVWIQSRKKNIRNQIQRTHKAVQDIETKFGADKDLMMVRASLESALLILDASLGGGSSAAV
jgi:hypothetical protein